MDSYLEAWRIFRQLSDENRVTTLHLINTPRWPRKDGFVLADIGCGDGRLLEEMMVQSPKSIKEIFLIDPDCDLLERAHFCLDGSGLVLTIHARQARFEDVFPACMSGVDAALLVHVVYLIDSVVFEKVLKASRFETPLYVVLDAITSVFTTLWARTAPKYHARVVAAHRTLSSLPKDRFDVTASTIKASICNPFAVSRPEVRDSLLSILTYADIGSSTDQELRDWIQAIIRGRANGNSVYCESTCYQIVGSGLS